MLNGKTSTNYPLSQTDILITIKPQHAASIFDGTKKYELRKLIPQSAPRRIFLYETDGRNEITGHIIINKLLRGSREAVWHEVSGNGVSKKRFEAYFKDEPDAKAYHIEAFQKYKEPIRLADLRRIEHGFKPPQNFLYLDNLPILRRVLDGKALQEALNSQIGKIRFRYLASESIAAFRKLVVLHITKSYLETGRKYAEKLLEVHRESVDREGVLSAKKIILEVIADGAIAGFAVLTEKIGGSIKTGPVIFHRKFHGKHIGTQMREGLHQVCLNAGYRKVYCTAPVNNIPAVRYLLASGNRVEAHLKRQYHRSHDEFVFGFNLTKSRAPSTEFSRTSIPINDFKSVTKNDPEVIALLKAEFSRSYCSVTDQWASEQVAHAVRSSRPGRREFKFRRMYSAYNASLVACALCVLKRGGAVKIILLTETGHLQGVRRFISYTEGQLLDGSAKRGIRKFYAHVPVTDDVLVNAFYSSGYAAEGILQMPYRQSDDLLVFGKLLSAD